MTKISWEVLDEVCRRCEDNNSDFTGIPEFPEPRSHEVITAYRQWKIKYGEDTLFGMVFKNGTDESPKVVIRLNDFPYNVEENILHYVVWLHPDQTRYSYQPRMCIELKNLVNDQLNIIHGKCSRRITDIIHFRNAPTLRTIGSIPHYHVFVQINNDQNIHKSHPHNTK